MESRHLRRTQEIQPREIVPRFGRIQKVHRNLVEKQRRTTPLSHFRSGHQRAKKNRREEKISSRMRYYNAGHSVGAESDHGFVPDRQIQLHGSFS